MKHIESEEDINLIKLIPRMFVKELDKLDILKNSIAKVFKPLTSKIAYEKDGYLDKTNLEATPEMEWLKKVKFKLIAPVRGKTEKEVLDKLIGTLKKECLITPDYVSDLGLGIVALDTETTGLNVTMKTEGGQVITNIDLVGVPIASSDKKGYYLPVLHNGTDGVKNFSSESIRYFLQRVVDEFFIVYFNYDYDGSVLLYQGVEQKPKQYADIMHVGNALGLDTLPDLYGSLGLKRLSDYFLDRKMLEIHEVVGSKNYIVFSSISATDATVYACSDAVNTAGLFNVLVLDIEEEEQNPYKYNGDMLYLDHQTLFHHISMFKHGLPLNHLDSLTSNLKTIYNRMTLLEDSYANIKHSEDYAIGTPEKVNMFIAKTVLENALRKYKITLTEDIFNPKHKQATKIENILHNIDDHFGIILKMASNKSRGDFIKAETRKVGWGKSAKGVAVLDYTKIAIKNEYWLAVLSSRCIKNLSVIVNTTDNYRGLVLEAGRLGKMLRYAVGDDRGYAVVDGGLRFSKADTRRYTNSAGTGGDRIIFGGANQTNPVFYAGNGLSGINMQGLPKIPYMLVTPRDGCRKPRKIIAIEDRSYNNWIKTKERHLQEKLKLNMFTKLSGKK